MVLRTQELAGTTNSAGDLQIVAEAATSEVPGNNINQDANVAVNSNGAIMIKFYA
jgi:hypothetical protein